MAPRKPLARRGRRLVAAALAVAVLVLPACTTAPLDPVPTARATAPAPTPAATPDEAATPEGPWRVDGEPTTVATGLRAPWSVVAAPGGGVLVSERDTGLIREVLESGEVRDVGTVPGVVAGGESGLHGLAVRAEPGGDRLYAYHGSADDNRVVRFDLRGGPGDRSLGEAEVVFSGIPRANTHNGGRIAFGPDGFLYVTTGDAQVRDAAQDPDALGGKILRLTPDGEPAPGNPFGGPVYSLGHRNVQGIAWNADGTLWASEFGQNTWDELNRIEPGANYGWPVVEGRAGDDRFTDPVAVWPPAEASPSGIAVVGGTVFVAGLRGGRLWAVTGDAAEVALTGQGRLRDVVAADGMLWVLTNNTDGRGDPRPEDDVLLAVPVRPAD